MSYSKPINRADPTCMVFLVDQSESMNDRFGGSEVEGSKSKEVGLAMNRLLQNLVVRCAKEEGVRRYFDIAVIGYSGAYGVRSILSGALAGRELVGIDEIAANPMRVIEVKKKQSDGAGGLVEVTARLPLWFDPEEPGAGGTPMCQAFETTHAILASWIERHQSSYPPIVINLTDGEATDWTTPQDLVDRSNAIRQLATLDGNVLIFNMHLSSTRAPQIHFPKDSEMFSNQYSKVLFDASSAMPPHTLQAALEAGYTLSDGARGFVFNADIADVISFLNIGTFPANMR
jgi:hypothetical protein